MKQSPIIELLPPFFPQGGSCYAVSLPSLGATADDEHLPVRSPLVLFEDGVPLQPPHASHDYIATDGKGAYSHWKGQLFFSTSDGSDPNTNNRRYTVQCDDETYRSTFSKERAGHRHFIMSRPFVAQPGHCVCFTISQPIIDGGRLISDTPTRIHSTLVVYENGEPLCGPHSDHDEIADTGHGAYSHWQNQILFSSSDGSDPQANGREYTFTIDVDSYLSVFSVPTTAPVTRAFRIDGPFKAHAGRCWEAHLSPLLVDELQRRKSTVAAEAHPFVLLEDGAVLGPDQALRTDIESIGGGLYFYDGTELLLFSTGDDSDPNTNSHQYAFAFDVSSYCATAAIREERAQTLGLSGLYPCIDTEPHHGDTKRICTLFSALLERLPAGAQTLAGRSVLEVGPGPTLGMAVAAACLGAQVTAIERYPAPWNDDYHLPFFNDLRQQLPRYVPGIPVQLLDEIISTRCFPTRVLTRIDCGIEDTKLLPTQHFDIVFSVAVLEHVANIPQATKNLHRLSAPDALGIHWIDCSDHRNPALPLEYLLLDEEAFRLTFSNRRGTCGNRLRVADMEDAFTKAGFSIEAQVTTRVADEQYLASLVERMQVHRPEVTLPEPAELARLGCLLIVRPR